MIISCGIFLFDTNTFKFLICHATKARKKQWSIPKGLRDKGESSMEAARRELLEETGIDLNEIHILGIHILPPVKYQKTNKTLESFLVITDTDLSNKALHCKSMVNEKYPEIDKYQWVTIEEMPTIIHEAQVKLLDQVRKIVNEGVYNQ